MAGGSSLLDPAIFFAELVIFSYSGITRYTMYAI